MQKIQWYPGHMYKANKEIKQVLPLIDVIIEVLDARIPFSSENPLLAELRGDKPTIKVLSKSDLADPEKTAAWQNHFDTERNTRSLAITTQNPDKMKLIVDLCRGLAPEKVASEKDVRVMIMGIPNVGKSTLINILAGRTIAKTGNEPAVTKGQQRIELDGGVMLFDTPGVLWPNLENHNSGYRLAVSGAIKDTAIQHDDVAYFAAEFLLRSYPDRLLERYQLDSLPDSPVSLLETIGAKRGCLVGGGHVDYDKVSKILLNELRSGKLGALTLEMPQEMLAELAQLEVIRAEKIAQKEARANDKKKRKQKRKR